METQLDSGLIARQFPQHLRPADSFDAKENKPTNSKLATILTERRGQFLRFLTQRLDDRDEAEDVLQDFYIRVLKKADQIRNAGATIAWLRVVLKSVLADHFRHKASDRRAHQLMEAHVLATSPQKGTSIPEEEVDRGICTCFYRLLPTLKREYSDALLRVDLAEQTRAEAARTLGITPGNMRVRLHRARRALKAALKRSCPQCHEHDCFGVKGLFH